MGDDVDMDDIIDEEEIIPKNSTLDLDVLKMDEEERENDDGNVNGNVNGNYLDSVTDDIFKVDDMSSRIPFLDEVDSIGYTEQGVEDITSMNKTSTDDENFSSNVE